MKKKTIGAISLIIILSLIGPVRSYANTQGKKGSDLDGLIAEALNNNPEVQVASSEWEAARCRIPQEYSLPDPTARYTYFGESVETRVGPQKNKYGASIKIPFPSKLYLRGKAQVIEAEALKERYEGVKREVIKEVKFVYYDIYWIDKAIEITEQEKHVAENVEKVAEKKYETNQARQQDVIKVQIELSNFADKLLRLKQHRKSLVARMNDILSRPQGTEMSIRYNVDLPDFNYELKDLSEIALKGKQELIAAKLDAEKAGYERSLATQGLIPDLTIGFDYIQVGDGQTMSPDDGEDAWMTTFSINIPLWFHKELAKIEEKKAILKARQQDVESMENKVLYTLADLYYKVLTYKDIVTLYKTALVPQSQQATEATKAGYETGDLNFIDWLDAERVFLKTQLAYYKAIVDYMKSIAFLERIVGQDICPVVNKRSLNAEMEK